MQKEKKKVGKKNKRKTPQNCKRPTQRQRFITTRKSVIEKNLTTLIRFHSANKINNYNRGKKQKKKKNPKETSEQVKIYE